MVITSRAGRDRADSVDAMRYGPVMTAKTPPPPSRIGTSPITVFVPRGVRDRLKILAAQQGRPMQDMALEALNDLFRKYGVSDELPPDEDSVNE
jgi:hypothetical protein